MGRGSNFKVNWSVHPRDHMRKIARLFPSEIWPYRLDQNEWNNVQAVKLKMEKKKHTGCCFLTGVQYVPNHRRFIVFQARSITFINQLWFVLKRTQKYKKALNNFFWKTAHFDANRMEIGFLIGAVPDEKYGVLEGKHYIFLGVLGVNCCSI